MKVFNLLLLLTLCSVVSGKTYYVAPNGNDNNPGTITQPWKTWGKAFNWETVAAGDTVYFRGGIYYKNISEGDDDWYYPARSSNGTGYAITRNGVLNDTLCYFTYPGETPVLDCVYTSPPGVSNYGIRCTGVNYVKFKGLTIRNVLQVRSEVEARGWNIIATNTVIENCSVYNIQGNGFRIEGANNLFLINCDAYNCNNSLDSYPGSQGTGFRTLGTNPNYKVYFIGCRAWKNSDQGFSLGDEYNELRNCWSFANTGEATGDGHGFKLGWLDYDATNLRRLVINCIAAYNAGSGFTTNDNGYPYAGLTHIYNNTSYSNDIGFIVFNTKDSETDELRRTFRNNLAYDNTYDVYIMSGASYTHSNNSWDASPSVTVTDSDFLTLDSIGLSGARKGDGSLPDLNFLKLASSSDLIDAGIDLGLNDNGTLPDIGAYESIGSIPVEIKVTGIAVTGAAGSSQISQDNGTLQLSATITPSGATNKTVTWSVINGTGQATISSTGLVSAVANGMVTARASANDGSGIIGSMVITISNQVIQVTGITVSGAGGSSQISQDNGTLQLSATITPSGATNKTVTWSVINGTGQATISSTGLVSAVANGMVTAKVSANDGSGIYGTFVITITNQQIPANQPPIVTISSPTKSTAFISPASITIHADASDPDGTINKVEFYEGNTKLGEVTKYPYDFGWKNVTDGTYTITAVAIDNQNLKTTSASVSVVVEKSTTTVNQLPIVSITSPNNKKNFKKNDKVTIEAVASDPDGTITKVEFKCGSTTLCELTTAPYIYSSNNLDTGTYVITAIATDNLGASNASSDLQFTIDLYYDEHSEIVNLYPNPNDGHFSVDFLNPEVKEGKITMTIINLRGEAVSSGILEEVANTKDFDLSGQASGPYILMVTKKNEIIATKKFIKN